MMRLGGDEEMLFNARATEIHLSRNVKFNSWDGNFSLLVLSWRADYSSISQLHSIVKRFAMFV